MLIDHYSRRVMGFAVFRKQPTGKAVREFPQRTFRRNWAKPRYLVSDKGTQFWCERYKQWCRLKNVRPRFGAVGKRGSIAVVERLIRSMKDERTRRIAIPLRRGEFLGELASYFGWYNEYRPHSVLGGRTPNEAYHKRRGANRLPRWEPRANWPRPSSCATPQTLVKGRPGVRLQLHVEHYAGRKHLPIVRLRRAT